MNVRTILIIVNKCIYNNNLFTGVRRIDDFFGWPVRDSRRARYRAAVSSGVNIPPTAWFSRGYGYFQARQSATPWRRFRWYGVEANPGVAERRARRCDGAPICPSPEPLRAPARAASAARGHPRSIDPIFVVVSDEEQGGWNPVTEMRRENQPWPPLQRNTKERHASLTSAGSK